MRCAFGTTLVVLLIASCAETAEQPVEQPPKQTVWHVEYYPQTGDLVTAYHAAQIANIPVVTMDKELATKTHLTMMFACSPSMGGQLGMQINLLYDEQPKYTTNRKRSGNTTHYEVMLYLNRAGLKEPRFYKTDVFTWGKGSMVHPDRSLGILSDYVLRILAHDELRICVLSEWDGKPVMSIVPLKGAKAAVNKVMDLCGMSIP